MSIVAINAYLESLVDSLGSFPMWFSCISVAIIMIEILRIVYHKSTILKLKHRIGFALIGIALGFRLQENIVVDDTSWKWLMLICGLLCVMPWIRAHIINSFTIKEKEHIS